MRIKYKSETPDDLKRTSYVVKVSFLEIYNEKVQGRPPLSLGPYYEGWEDDGVLPSPTNGPV